MRVEIATHAVPGPDGTPKSVRTTTVHCSTCNQFVRMHEMETSGPLENRA